MPRPAYKTLGEAITAVMDNGGITTVDLAARLRDRGWKPDQSLVSKWRNGHLRPHDIDLYPDIEAICGVPRGTIFRLAGYIGEPQAFKINRDDPEEVAIWNLKKLPEQYRREIIAELREINTSPPPPTRKSGTRRRGAA